MKKILVMNGPNLNLTGIRKKNVYGAETLEDINRELAAYGEDKGVQVDFYIARSIAEGHHGTIRAESPDGCTVIFTAELR